MTLDAFRLAPPFGTRLDRRERIRFRFESREYEGFAGDTIASALAANGVRVLSRSFKYHRPRGIYSMAGHDANTLVQLPREPNVLADLRPICAGLEVRAQNVNGSLEHDRDAILGRLSRFLPAGFYYSAFYRPRGAWKFWEPLIRKKAGLGALDLTHHAHEHYDKQFLHCDVAIVGAGPAGLSAALEAARHGAEVIIIDEHPHPGGSLNYARFDVDGTAATERDRLVHEIAAVQTIRCLSSATCTGLFADNWLAVAQGARLFKIRARRVVLASGGYEQIAVFRNNDLPGVMAGSAAQRLIREFGVRPGTRAVVATGSASGYAVALDLLDAGVAVGGVVDFRARPDDDVFRASVRERGIEMYEGHGLFEACPAPRNLGLTAVRIAPIVASTQLDSGGLRSDARGTRLDARGTKELPCDLLCVSPGWMPAYQLAAQAGASLRYDEALASFVPDQLAARMDVAGGARGLSDLQAILDDGRRAGWHVAHELGLTHGDPPTVHQDRAQPTYPSPVFAHPQGKDFVDLDEDLQVRDIEHTCALGYDDIQLTKRFSTLGMGPSQGRLSALSGARVVARATGRDMAAVNVTTARPPFAGEKLAVLAGRAFDPVRRTAMHHRHLEAGAQMMPAGAWLRPAYYGAVHAREQAIEGEVRNVHENVGLIDVSTLGGLEVRGPDAAEFIERLYAGTFKNLRVGMSRYGLMCNDMGTVIDDGVIARLHPLHFYVTATTTGVDAIYRKMLWWNAQWRLDVDVANVTAAYSGINIAGPRSREVLARVCREVDLTAAAFPYLAVRVGHVAGILARIMRVGFVGELGYEIHVPAGEGEALWDALVEAGRDVAIRPFGVEAQRLLRLEKGHVIVGQDTDGISTPDESGATWAVKDDKPFFVGQHAIRVIRRISPARRLVGFKVASQDPAPEEGNLVLMGEAITGHVTSIGRSQAVDATIGLAFAHRDQSAPGRQLELLLTDGRVVKGEVVALPFYDPPNARQKM